RRRADRTACPRDRRPRHRPRARGPPPVPHAHRRREPQDGRVPPGRPPQLSPESRASLRALPRARRATGPARGQSLRRRAADARAGPGAHVHAPSHPARRAVHGPGAGAGAAALRPHPSRPRRGLHDPGRRAERPASAEARRSRVPARGRPDPHGRPRPRAGRAGLRQKGLRGPVIDPLFLLEAAINGVLLGGVLALLALGLNLIFGVLDVVWIAYVDLVMVCMYLVYFLVMGYGWPVWLGGLAGIGLGVLLGLAVHVLIITPILSSPPVNQL